MANKEEKQFRLFDLDNDNHLDYHELKVAMKALGFEVPKQELTGILQKHGVQHSTILAPGQPGSATGAGKRRVGPATGKMVIHRDVFERLVSWDN